MRLVSRSRLHRLGQVPVLNAFPDFGLFAGDLIYSTDLWIAWRAICVQNCDPLAGLRTGDNGLFEGRDLIGEKAMNPMPFAIVGLSLFINPALAQTQLPPPTSVPPATESKHR